jgi:saccharopine dehydrogenase (NAD+, L-lysine-forming)
MEGLIGIRRENMDVTEKRSPLTPGQVKSLIQTQRIQIKIESAENRIYREEDYKKAGAIISSDLSDCNVVFGIKEIPTSDIHPGQTYCFFSHTVKGQPYNMSMLKRILDLKNTLMDYERVIDEEGKRLIFFGNFAGYAGMIDSIWALGLRLAWEGISNPFSSIKQAKDYKSLEAAKEEFRRLGKMIQQEGIPAPLVPLLGGFTGYGHVSQGAQEIFDLLPHENIDPHKIAEFFDRKRFSDKKIYKVVFKESDLVAPRDLKAEFNLQEYYQSPEKYSSIFKNYVPYFTMLINGIYWEEKYPRLITKNFLKNWIQRNPKPRLRVIGDISCDVNGSIECNVKTTNSEHPLYVYHPLDESITDGHAGEGIVILAVDKLPTELPREASEYFGNQLITFLPQLAHTNFQLPATELFLPPEFQKAVIVHQGQLMPDYKYLVKFIKK